MHQNLSQQRQLLGRVSIDYIMNSYHQVIKHTLCARCCQRDRKAHSCSEIQVVSEKWAQAVTLNSYNGK